VKINSYTDTKRKVEQELKNIVHTA